MSAPPAPAPRRLSHATCGVLLFVAALLAYPELCSFDRGPLQIDWGSLFLDTLIEQRRALLDGHLLLWDPLQCGGTPSWPLPNTARLYPPLFLCVLSFGALGGLNVALLLHLAFGAIGVYALVARLSDRRFAGLQGGLVFLMAWWTQHFTQLLPLELLALAWIPWTLFALLPGLRAERWVRCAIAAGLCYAAVIWVGGYILFLLGLWMVALVTAAAALAVRGASPRRVPVLLGVFALTVLALSAGRLLPTYAWVALTDRSSGVSSAAAVADALGAADLWAWLAREGWLTLLLVLAGPALWLGASLGKRRGGALAEREPDLGWGLAFAGSLAVLAAASTAPVYRFLYEHVPGFDLLRDPRRWWGLTPVLLATGAGLGLAACQARSSLRGAARAVAAAAVLLLFAADVRVQPRHVPPVLVSLSERLEQNHLHAELARRSESETRFRVIDYADCRPKLKRTADLVRAAYGIESVEGLLGNVLIAAWDLDFIVTSRELRARTWGLVNCRYVTSEELLDEPGLRFLAELERDPEPLVPGSDGPFLYENELALPRAYTVERAVLLVSVGVKTRRQLVLRQAWDPRTTALVELTREQLSALDPAELPPFAAVVVDAGGGVPRDELERWTRAVGVPLFDVSKASVRELAALHDLLGGGAPYRALPDPPRAHNGTRVDLGGDGRAGAGPEGGERWLVLAETYSLFPGWSAELDGAPAPLLRANAAATAVPLRSGAREARFDYRPPGLALGLAISAASFACALALARPRRRPGGNSSERGRGAAPPPEPRT